MSMEGGGGYLSEGSEEFSVEAIIGWRYSPENRCKEYHVKWEGYSIEESTWEPESNLNCPDLIILFERSLDPEDRENYESPQLDRLDGFSRHAKLRDILSLQLVGGDHCFVCQFDDSVKLEQIPFHQVLKFSPIRAIQFLGDRSIRSDVLDSSDL